MPFLKKRKEKRKYVARPGIEPRTPDLRVRCPTDCATRPGFICMYKLYPGFICMYKLYLNKILFKPKYIICTVKMNWQMFYATWQTPAAVRIKKNSEGRSSGSEKHIKEMKTAYSIKYSLFRDESFIIYVCMCVCVGGSIAYTFI